MLRYYLAELGARLKASRGAGKSTAPPPSPPSFEHAWLRYRQAAIWGLVIGWLICPPVNYGEAITTANVGRMAKACEDLATLEALGVTRQDARGCTSRRVM